MKNNQELLQKAKNYSFLLLKFRPRSEKEIYQRLKKKKFDDRIIKETLSFLKDKGFIDDKLFAKTWIESRLKEPLGLKKIINELNLKGIAKEIIESEILQIKENYSEEDVVTKIAKDRITKLKGTDPQKAKRRLYAYLLRRGFSGETVYDVIAQLCKQMP